MIRIVALIVFFLSGCSEDVPQAESDPFLLGLREYAEAYEMPEGFVEEFARSYLSETVPLIDRLEEEASPIDREAEIWNLRMMIYTSLWADHGVDLHYIPRMTMEDYASTRSDVVPLRKDGEMREIEVAGWITRGSEIQKAEAALAAFGYSKGLLNKVHIDQIREFVGLPEKEHEKLESLKIWRVGQGYLLISHLVPAGEITNLTFYLKEAQYSADAVDFEMNVSSFDPSTGQLVIETK